MNLPRLGLPGRRRLLAAAAGAAALAAPVAHAQSSYPVRSIRMIVPYSIGGASGVLGQGVAEKMTALLGQSVYVEERTGANGILGAQAAATATPDGYTIVLLNDGTAALNQALYPKLPYDMQKDFVPLSYGGDVRMVLIVNPSVPARNVAELLKIARGKHGDMNYASGGAGSVQQILMEIFMDATGTRFTHVPYKGVIPAVSAVAGGQVPVMFAGLAGALPLIQAGRVRALAVTSADRQDSLADVPTLSEEGVAGFPTEPWNAFFAPAGTPPEIVKRLNWALTQALNAPDVREKLKLSLGVRPSTPEELKKIVDRDIARYGALVRKVGIRLD
ncbi:tripartite tricarboxylate transporter substrate binding protein [Pigmentiphaga soli]|uniref:Tripartite tricarboxylate transporter substrate binding protein n=1 Tax=Pigmentiphaga soli TaxID=1007095 RepID=A0ABP8GHJ0_9BURK